MLHKRNRRVKFAQICACAAKRNERAERVKAEDFDAEEGEVLKDKNKQEEEPFNQVTDCLGTLLKTFKAPILPPFDELLPYLMHIWVNTSHFDLNLSYRNNALPDLIFVHIK